MMPFQCFPNIGKFLASLHELWASISVPLKSVSPELKAEANEIRMSWISRQLQEDKKASTLGGEPLSGLWPMAIGSIHGATTSSVHSSYVWFHHSL